MPHSPKRMDYVPTNIFSSSDFARAKVLVSAGARGPEDLRLSLDFLRRLIEYAEMLQGQRSALRAVLRAVVEERDGRLFHRLDGDNVVPMRPDVERSVRIALDRARRIA